MAVENISIGAKIINHKGLIGEITSIESSEINVLLEDGTYKSLTKSIVARWWKDYDENSQVVKEIAVTKDPEIEAVVEAVAEKTAEELAKEKEEKAKLKKEREAERKAQLEVQKARLEEMRDWIIFSILEKYPELEMKTNSSYVAVKFMGRVTMEIHYKGDCNRLYILPQGEDFIESTLFNRKDGSKVWVVRQGYEVPVQKSDEVQAEIIRLFEASKQLVEARENEKAHEKLRKKAEKEAKKEAKTPKELKAKQAKKDKKRLEEIVEAQEELSQAIPQDDAEVVVETVILQEESEETF